MPFVADWGAFLFPYFFMALTSGSAAADAVPPYVWATLIGIFAQYLLFPLNMLLWMLQLPWPVRYTPFVYELVYILLSFVSKTFLVLTISIGIAAGR